MCTFNLPVSIAVHSKYGGRSCFILSFFSAIGSQVGSSHFFRSFKHQAINANHSKNCFTGPGSYSSGLGSDQFLDSGQIQEGAGLSAC